MNRTALLFASLVLTATATYAQGQRANEMGAVGALKTIGTAQMLFREADKDGNDELDYAADIQALADTNLIDDLLGSGVKHGYRFTVSRSTEAPEFMWMATAEPIEPGKSGTRYFAINHEGVVYHGLKAFPLNDKCSIKGVPVGKKLEGWAPEPLRGLAKVLDDAKNSNVVPQRGERYFAVKGEFRGAKMVIQIAELKPNGGLKSGMARLLEDASLAVIETDLVEGKLTEVEVIQQNMKERKRTQWRGAIKGDSLTWLTGTPREAVPVREGALPLHVALFVLPSLHGQLRANGFQTFDCPVLVDAETVLEGDLRIDLAPADPPARPQQGEGEHAVTVSHPQLGNAAVWVDEKGAILAVKTFEGGWLEPMSKEAANQVILKVLGNQAGGNLVEARKAANETAALGALKTIATAQVLFREADKERDGELDYARDLGELGKTNLIDGRLASGEKNGYTFELCAGSDAPEFTWMAIASPIEPGKTGTRHFAINHEGVTFTSKEPFVLDRKTCKIEGGTPFRR